MCGAVALNKVLNTELQQSKQANTVNRQILHRSVAEKSFLMSADLQACDLDGEVDLSSCYDVTEFPVQRNYGFQILVSSTHQHSTTTRL